MSASGHATADQRAGTSGHGPGPGSSASVADLISRLGEDVTVLFRQEVELAKVEVKREGVRAAKAGAMLGAAAVLGLVTLLLVAWAVAWGLSEALPTWASFLITAVVFGAAAGALGAVGRKRATEIDLTPYDTIESLEEDKQMISDRMSR